MFNFIVNLIFKIQIKEIRAAKNYSSTARCGSHLPEKSAGFGNLPGLTEADNFCDKWKL